MSYTDKSDILVWNAVNVNQVPDATGVYVLRYHSKKITYVRRDIAPSA